MKELIDIAKKAQRSKHPNVPDHALPKIKYSDRTSNGLTRCIIDFLRLQGWQALRRPTYGLGKAIGMTEGTGAGSGSSDAGAIDLSQGITDRVLDATRSTGTGRTTRSIESVAARFETDRLLLAEMRKTPPREPREAQRFWANIKPLALRSDPSLGPLVDRVARSLPAYLQWLASAPDADPAVALGLLQSGASNYLRAVDEFWQRVLLVVIDRIDVLVDLTLE